jgi:hypothetical protein
MTRPRCEGSAVGRAARGGAIALAAVACVAVALPVRAQGTFPPGGSDAFESTLTANIQVGTMTSPVDLRGPTVVLRGDPGGDPCEIQTEIVAMDLVGQSSAFGEVRVQLNPEISSTGRITSLGEGCTFPADSFFDVFVHVETEFPPLQLVNVEPVRVTNDDLQVIPPFFDSYVHPPPAIPLVPADDPEVGPVAFIAGQSTHRVEQLPTLSVDAGGPTGLDPADLHDTGNPPPANITRTALGLAAGDNVDALSYGLDVIDDFRDEAVEGSYFIAFSVDPAAVGRPNTGVNREATKPVPEAYGDEFVTYFFDSNIELVDEQSLVLQEGTPGDDLDALTGEPTSYPDADADGTPERPVFFSLAPGSPTLGTLGTSAASILFSRDGQLGVYASEADLGLVAGDDVDALCLQKSGLPDPGLRPGVGPPGIPAPGSTQFDYAVFSLAPGSPTLATLGASPGDLLVTDFSPSRPNISLPPTSFAQASELGLLDTDNLNALKCLMAVTIIPIDHPDDDGILLVNVGGTDSQIGPLDEYDGSYDTWEIRNPGVDAHGPYVHPLSELAEVSHFPPLDPLQVAWVGGPGDNCGFLHVHNVYEEHLDPDPIACGHGVFVPLVGPELWIERCTDVRDVADAVLGALDATVAQNPHLNVSASMHYMAQGVGGAGAAAPHQHGVVGAQANGAEPAGVALILVGAGRTNIGVDVYGGIGPDIGTPTPSLEPPLTVPEPPTSLGVLASAGALAALRRRRRRA